MMHATPSIRHIAPLPLLRLLLLPWLLVLTACDISEDEAAAFKALLDASMTERNAFTETTEGLSAERVLVVPEPDGYSIVIEIYYKGTAPGLDPDQPEQPGTELATPRPIPPRVIPVEKIRQNYCPAPKTITEYCQLGGMLAPPIEISYRDWYTDEKGTLTCLSRKACNHIDRPEE